MENEIDNSVVEDAERSLDKYIGFYENVNPELYAKHGEDAYSLVDQMSMIVYNIMHTDESSRAALIDSTVEELASEVPSFTKLQIKTLIEHFVDYYLDCLK